jgi:hypothetical protein
VESQFHAIQAIKQKPIDEQFSPIADINSGPVVARSDGSSQA